MFKDLYIFCVYFVDVVCPFVIFLLCCLFFLDIRIVISPLVSLNSSYRLYTQYTTRLMNCFQYELFIGVHVARSLVFCVVFCRSLLVFLSLFLLAMCCLSFCPFFFWPCVVFPFVPFSFGRYVVCPSSITASSCPFLIFTLCLDLSLSFIFP